MAVKNEFQVYDTRFDDLDSVNLKELTNSVLFFASGDFTKEVQSFELAMSNSGILEAAAAERKFFNFFVVTNNTPNPDLKNMLLEEGGLKDLPFGIPIILDPRGELGALFGVYDEKTEKYSSYVGVGIGKERLFEFEVNDFEASGTTDQVVKNIKKCLQ